MIQQVPKPIALAARHRLKHAAPQESTCSHSGAAGLGVTRETTATTRAEVAEAAEAQVVGDGLDHLVAVVGLAGTHHGAERLPQLIQAVCFHRGVAGPDLVAFRLDDLAADRRVARDLGGAARVARR